MSDSKTKKTQIKGRALISLFASWLFLVIAVTGFVLYIVPHGRIAYWVDWRLFGLTKTDWGNVHIVASLLFVIVGVWHIYYNWKAFLGHIRIKLTQSIRLKTELYITGIATIIIVASALYRVPPAGYLIDLNEAIKTSWIESPDYEPPFGHAELLSLKRFCKKTEIDLPAAIQELERVGIKRGQENQTIGEIAEANNVSPKDIFKIIKVFRSKNAKPNFLQPNRAGLTEDDVFERFKGTGIGKLTISEICEKNSVQIEICLERLSKHGIDAKRNDTVRKIAGKAELQPIQVLQKMLADSI